MAKRKTRRYRFKHSFPARWWRRYEYKHSSLAITAIVVFVLALDTAVVQALLLAIREAGLLGIFITGALFVSFFTAAPATVILLGIASDYNPFLIAVVAGAGSMLGDFIILRVFEEKVGYELAPLAKKFGMKPIVRVVRSRRFRPVAVLISAVFIASPLPDEAGLALLGLAKLPMYKLLALVFVLNSVGIFLLVMAARAVAQI